MAGSSQLLTRHVALAVVGAGVNRFPWAGLVFILVQDGGLRGNFFVWPVCFLHVVVRRLLVRSQVPSLMRIG